MIFPKSHNSIIGDNQNMCPGAQEEQLVPARPPPPLLPRRPRIGNPLPPPPQDSRGGWVAEQNPNNASDPPRAEIPSEISILRDMPCLTSPHVTPSGLVWSGLIDDTISLPRQIFYFPDLCTCREVGSCNRILSQRIDAQPRVKDK